MVHIEGSGIPGSRRSQVHSVQFTQAAHFNLIPLVTTVTVHSTRNPWAQGNQHGRMQLWSYSMALWCGECGNSIGLLAVLSRGQVPGKKALSEDHPFTDDTFFL